MRKATLIFVTAVLLLVLAGCTPTQLQVMQTYYGFDLSEDVEVWALAQPDQTITMQDGTSFLPDGTFVQSGGLREAVAKAQYGVCDSWRPVYDWFARSVKRPPTWEWFRKVLWRESGCGVDTYNEATGDSGPIQINPVHKKWIKAELGYDFDLVQDWYVGMEVAIHLWNKTGKCNWTPPSYCK